MYDADYDKYLNELKEEAENAGFTVKDSGKKAQYEDGMQRDDPTGKPKFGLMWPKGVPYEEQLIYRVAMHYMHGGQKYGDRNWETSCTEKSLDAHEEALWRHFTKFYAGVEDGEDHAAAIVWNINAVLLTRRNLKLKQTETAPNPFPALPCASEEVISSDLGDGVTMEIDPSERVPEWAKHSAKCCNSPVYSSLPFTLNDGCGKGLAASKSLTDDEAEAALKAYHPKPYIFPYIGLDTASTGKYHQKEILADNYAEAKFIFDDWLSRAPKYPAFPDPDPVAPKMDADLEWSQGDVLEEIREDKDDNHPFCWVYQSAGDIWRYKYREGSPSPESAMSSKKLFATYGPLVCTKGSHTGRTVGGA
jgi:hypothetical protein